MAIAPAAGMAMRRAHRAHPPLQPPKLRAAPQSRPPGRPSARTRAAAQRRPPRPAARHERAPPRAPARVPAQPRLHAGPSAPPSLAAFQSPCAASATPPSGARSHASRALSHAHLHHSQRPRRSAGSTVRAHRPAHRPSAASSTSSSPCAPSTPFASSPAMTPHVSHKMYGTSDGTPRGRRAAAAAMPASTRNAVAAGCILPVPSAGTCSWLRTLRPRRYPFVGTNGCGRGCDGDGISQSRGSCHVCYVAGWVCFFLWQRLVFL